MTEHALWSAIAHTLRGEIADGRFRPGDRLPTEAALARRFGVNRHTLRRALADLTGDGLVHTRQGAGAFVTGAPTDYRLGARVRFHQNLIAAGRVPGRRILALTTRHADSTESRALALAPQDRVHAISGISLADGLPIALFHSVFPADRLPDLPQYLTTVASVTQALALAGVADHIRAETRITAELADPAQAAQLHLRPGAPLLRSAAINHDPAGLPIEYGLTWFSGEKIALVVPGGGGLSPD